MITHAATPTVRRVMLETGNHRRFDRSPRLRGWRAAIARAAAILLFLATLFPGTSLARSAAGEPAIIICTAQGMQSVPASSLGLGLGDVEGWPAAPSSHQDDHCPSCRLAGPPPVLLPPAVVLIGTLAFCTAIDFESTEADPAAHALPRGSLSPRAPPPLV